MLFIQTSRLLPPCMHRKLIELYSNSCILTLLSLKFEPNPYLQWLPRYYDTNELDYVAESPHRFQQGSKPRRNLISCRTCHHGRHCPEPCTLLGICDRRNASNLSNKRNMNDEKARTPRNGGADSPHLIRPAIAQSAHSRLLSCARRIPRVPLTWPDACIITKKKKKEFKNLQNELTPEDQISMSR